MSLGKTFVNGIVFSNPVFRLALGLVPVLGITHLAWNGVYMGVLTTLILLGAVIVKLIIGNQIPKAAREFLYLATVAVLTTLVYRLLAVYRPEIEVSLGIYLPLIMVNGFVFNRLATVERPIECIVDALGMGIGYTLALTVIGVIREFIGLGQVFGVSVLHGNMSPFSLAAIVPGGLIIIGLMLAAVNVITGKGGELSE